ncbi:hypothetical protein [Rhodovulum sulfidophilum]|uniref:hypothetical protein n=1 Tax=Rhodovulum sulfidophilum TaxID=35806 RepID=UPI001F458C15|nr:hypothetical protein [Rhodovulum sulfidophilum]MCE8420770.1 hypothetical protein [Rhodovulum sulfidophilum]MCE8441578.1 hypothetical protein [Rhodovulum sulfidophilum]MCE8470734.1 hypothetical protein [Rhodovulum sulfidophilum]
MKNGMYELEDIIKAKTAMVDHLAKLSGGELLRGCCTQGCCGDVVQSPLIPRLETTYTKADLMDAKRAMLSTLEELTGGPVIAGCCTQGCCDDQAIAALINVP